MPCHAALRWVLVSRVGQFPPKTISSENISIQRALVAHHDQFLGRMSRPRLINRDLVPLRVGPRVRKSQAERGDNGAKGNADAEAIPQPVIRPLGLKEYVAADDAADITEGDEQCHAN